MYIDTHCHLEKSDYDDIDLVIKENREAGVSKIIVSGYSRKSIKEALKYACQYSDVYLTIGYHPSEVLDVFDSDIDELEKIIKSNNKIVGIGEIGLDYHYSKDDRDKQITLFKAQLALAEKLNLPVVIHTRDATKDTIDILKEFNVSGVIHCFSGKLEVAEEYIKMGFFLGIGGVLTFKNSNLYKVIEKVPLDNIVLETDSPYLTPEPFRGSKNSSKYIPIIAQKIALIKNIDVNDVSSVTFSNALKIFDLK